MAQLPVSDIPPFWTEPWRWAAQAWRSRYGAPPRDVDRFAERLIYSGWTECFGLRRRWRPPADPRWLIVVRASPAVLRDIASVLGHLASLRAGVSVTLACRPPTDPWQAFALKYRDVNCMRSQTTARCGEPSSPYAYGVSVLRAMARLDWPDADSRLAMLVAPDARCSGEDSDEPRLAPTLIAPDAPRSGEDSDAPRFAPTLIVDWIDVGRCLSLCCAVVRYAAAQAVPRGEQ